jgi:hypothetical protein
LGRRGSDRSNAHAADLTGIIVELEENIEERFDAVCTRENDPVIDMRVLY